MSVPVRDGASQAASESGSRRQYQTLDGLRGVAALGIVVLHTPHFFDHWHLPYSFLAVDLFFVLSGFVLAASYETKLQSGMTAMQFLRIRLLRLYPLYLLGTMLGVPVALMAMRYGGNGLSVEWSQGLFWSSLPLSLLMLPTPTTGVDGVLYPFNPVLWTLFFEIAVNLLYALLARQLSDNRWLLGVVIVSAAALVTYGLGVERPDGGPTWGTFTGGLSRMMFSFFCGVLICRLRRPATIQSSLLAVSLLASLLVLFAIPHTNATALGTILLVFPALVLTGASVEPEPGLSRAFRLLGSSSYAVYAVHKPLYQILLGFLIVTSPVKPQSMAPWIGIGYLIVVFVASVLIDRVYDVPVRRWLGTWRGQRTAANTASG